MRSQTWTSKILRERRRLNITFQLALRSAFVITLVFAAREACCQADGNQQEMIRQVPAPLPKLALNGSSHDTKAGVPFRKIVLTITNWEKYPAEMFQVQSGRRLPPNQCSQTSSRIVISVYSERGDLLTGCIAVATPANLGRFALLIPKGKSLPEFVYAVVSDRFTDAAYRSNLVSPSSGATK